MMHIRTTDNSGMSNSGLVVAVTDDNSKSLREYDFNKVNDKTRKCKVKITPDNEYKILIKNDNFYRVLANVEIDGTVITTSKIIIEACSSVSLESFIESHKKFKAVFANNEAVQDPSSGENGLIRVELFKEKQSQYITSPFIDHHHHHHHHHDIWHRDNWSVPTVWCGGSNETLMFSSAIQQNTAANCLRGDMSNITTSASYTPDETDKLATIEGSASDQRFVTDYTWKGVEGDPYIFKFELLPILKCEHNAEAVATMAKHFGVSIDKAKKMMDEMTEKLLNNQEKFVKDNPKKSRKKK